MHDKKINLKAKNTQTINPQESKMIQMKTNLVENVRYADNLIFYIKGACNTNLMVGKGTFDINTNLNNIMVYSPTNYVQKIQQNFTIAKCEFLEECEIEELSKNRESLDKLEIMKKYHGPKECWHQFKQMIDELNTKNFEHKKLEIKHKINLKQPEIPKH